MAARKPRRRSGGFDWEEAERTLAFFRLLKDPKGGTPKERPCIRWLPWQEKLIADIFATKKADGTRQYREAFIEVPRKNGKTTTIAGCVNRQLFLSPEYGQEIYSAANDRDQAAIVFQMAASMIRANPALSKRCRIYDSTKRIVRTDTESFYRALSKESATAHGLNPSFVIYDELHEAKTRDLYDVLKTGMGARKEPLFVTITTAGSDVTGICYELYTYAKQVRDGIVQDPTFYPLIFEADPDDDIWDEKTWRKANPSAGHFRSLDEIREMAERAKALPSQEIAFRRLYLNQWVQGDTRWIRRETWDGCEDREAFAGLEGRICYAGLDLSSTDDFTALVLVFPLEDERFAVLPFFWIPEAKLQKHRKNGVELTPWVRAGYIEATPGEVIDYGFIFKRLEALKEKYNIKEIAFDRWGAAKLRVDLEGMGFTMVQFGQGFSSMSAPSKEMERLMAEGQLAHDGNPVLRWMADNVVVQTDAAGNIKPDKKKSSEKIDGIVATIMALDRAIRWREGQSGYETHDLRVIDLS